MSTFSNINRLSSGRLFFVVVNNRLGVPCLDLLFENGKSSIFIDVVFFSVSSNLFTTDEVNSGPYGPRSWRLAPDFSGIKFEGRNLDKWDRETKLNLIRSIFDEWKVSMENSHESISY